MNALSKRLTIISNILALTSGVTAIVGLGACQLFEDTVGMFWLFLNTAMVIMVVSSSLCAISASIDSKSVR